MSTSWDSQKWGNQDGRALATIALTVPGTPVPDALAKPAQSPDAHSPLFSPRLAYAQTFLATCAVRGFGIISGVLAARLLGPAGRGELEVIILLPTLVAALGGLGLSQAIAYEVSKSPGSEAKVASAGFWTSLGLGTVQMLLLGWLIGLFLPPEKQHLARAAGWFVLYLPAVYTGWALLGVDQGRGRFKRFSAFQVLPGAIYAGLALLLWASHRVSPAGFALAILTGAVLTAVIRGSAMGRLLFHTRPSWQTILSLLKRGISFHLPAMAGLALMRADTVMLVRLVPSAAIGLYAVASAIAVGHVGTANPFVQVGFTAVAAEQDAITAAHTLARQFRFAQLAIGASGLAAALLAPWIIRLAFGARFAGAVITTYFLVAAMSAWGLAQVLEHGLRALARPQIGIVSNLLALAVLVAAGIPASLHWGIAGMAAALLAAQLVNLGTLLSFSARRFGLPWASFWGVSLRTVGEFRQSGARLQIPMHPEGAPVT
jgi:O-antigen/teichoic acid export membrane protein